MRIHLPAFEKEPQVPRIGTMIREWAKEERRREEQGGNGLLQCLQPLLIVMMWLRESGKRDWLTREDSAILHSPQEGAQKQILSTPGDLNDAVVFA